MFAKVVDREKFYLKFTLEQAAKAQWGSRV
jgi:hypothetical protein